MRTQVLIIGGGATGTGLARDLALRGVHCTVVEKSHLSAGASGRNHGLLHSGARYVGTDPIAAKQCHEENLLLKKLASQCIEDTHGLFVAIEGDDENYVADFPHLCAECGIPAEAVSIEEARQLEPGLSSKLIGAYKVDDASIEPYRLCLENMTQAQSLGSLLLTLSKVTAFTKQGNRIVRTTLTNAITGEVTTVEADFVVNAAGAWTGAVAELAGIPIKMLYSKGSLMVAGHRITSYVVNRLRKPGDGDIVVPGGTVSILGTTSLRVESPEVLYPTLEEMDHLIEEGAEMLPALQYTRFIRAYAGIRPLLELGSGMDDRSVSRSLALLDHSENGVDNFLSVPGGKLTTYRLMAEKAADVICERLGVHKPCRTRSEPLPSTAIGGLSEPGLGPRIWIKKNDPGDRVLCECEILPESLIRDVISSLREERKRPNLLGIADRSRVGKGACQGTFCGSGITAYLYNNKDIRGRAGLDDLRDFLQERWKGERPVLWRGQLIQAELKESFYCGLCGLEMQGG
ncbi:MAG: anaerobic glycerol-3-phosphate dehydrogenase subunit A [Deltaproteobacteria bacterium]|nr:anaerobic glycerol-3-phosphate dehydrogenase subunit A [Deltaproteobacteria bacterium]